MEIKRLLQTIVYMTLFHSIDRGNYVRKHNLFGSCGKNVRLPQMNIPYRSEYIYLHNNIEIASGARLIPHDAIHSVFNGISNSNQSYKEHIGKIEIFDNVFIGANAIILGPVKIGPNAIIGAGAVVTKDVEEGSVVGGGSCPQNK